MNNFGIWNLDFRIKKAAKGIKFNNPVPNPKSKIENF
jgi:hypothetical protein